MKRIAALIDFTPTTQVVIQFAEQVARQKNCEVALIHVTDQEVPELNPLKEKLDHLSAELNARGIKTIAVLEKGNFFNVIRQILDRSHAGLVIIGTHGKRGIMQNLFGSHILKLVKMLHIPSLVVQENSTWPENGFQTVLLPVASHSDFEMKIRQTVKIVNKDALIKIYVIYKTDHLDDTIKKNLKLAQNMLAEMNVPFEVIEEDVQLHSVGYSRQTLEHLQAHPVSLVSIMAQVSQINKYFGDADKENIILNPMGIPVLCCDE
jgi:nucleotide-binding universal stress UspA family protein